MGWISINTQLEVTIHEGLLTCHVDIIHEQETLQS